MFGFIFGLIAGGAAVWFYGPEIRRYVDSGTRGMRAKAADTLQKASQGLQTARDRMESSSPDDVSRSAGEAASAAAESMRSAMGGETHRRIG